MRNLSLMALAAMLVLAPLAAQADTTSLATAPSTGTQKAKTASEDITYFGGPNGDAAVGLEFGLTDRLQVGGSTFDTHISPVVPQPTGVFNAKYRLFNQSGNFIPSLAIGANGYAYHSATPMPSQLYVAAGEHMGPLELTLGEYTSNKQFQAATLGAQRTNGFGGLAFDLGKIRLAGDVTLGDNAFGRRSYEASYALTNRLSFGAGEVVYNNKAYGQNGGVFSMHIQLP